MAGLLPPADDVVEEEVVEFIGADDRLGALNRTVLACGNQLGADFGRKDIGQHGVDAHIELRGLRGPANEVLDQRLGHARIDRVMAHLVAHAVGTPPQRELAEVAGADDPAAILAGQAEEVVGAQARLNVLEGRVIDRFAIGEGMTDVLEHQPRGGRDVDLLGGDAEGLHQPPGIRLGVVRGGEAGQGIAADIAARTPQPVHRLGRDDQRMRAVEPARNTDGQAFRPGCLDPPHERIDLDVERLVAVLVELVRAVGYEGEPPDRAVEADVCARRGALECDPPVPVLGASGGLGGIVEGLHAHPLGQDPLRIDIGDAQFGGEIEAHALGHQIAQFVDHPLPVPREVGGAFAMPAGRIGIGADRPARACAAE